MKATMVIPSYWGRKTSDRWRKSDDVYDHPTPLDEEGTLLRLLKSLEILKNKQFNLVILGVAAAEDIRDEVEGKLAALIKQIPPEVETFLFSYSGLSKIYDFLKQNNREAFIPLLKLGGYSNVRNLCTFLPHLLGSEVAVLIDDDEVFEDELFMNKAFDFIGQRRDNEKILAKAGYYINPDNDFLLNRQIDPWMTHWNKIDCMNRAFNQIISQEPRLKPTPFAFGGNLVIHRELFSRIPFDPSVPRGEDIDFLINARMFGYQVYLDNQLSIKHLAPSKSSPTWVRVREDVVRFIFEKNKLDTQEDTPGMERISAEELDPYPGEFLKANLEERIFRSNQMLAIDYLSRNDHESALECMNNIFIARTMAAAKKNPFQGLRILQKNWEKLMDFFSSDKTAKEACDLIQFPRE